MESIKNRLRVNNQDYEVILTLYNPQGIAFPINAAGMVSLVIEESILEWYKQGYIILENNENIIERRPNEFTNKADNYKFRNDGRDLLFVNIKPILESDKDSVVNEDLFPAELWDLSYIFSVYDVEDIIMGDTTQKKYFKLYFWEADYQVFTETTGDWNTNSVLYEQFPNYRGRSAYLADEDRKVPTGLAIKDLIKATLEPKMGPQKFAEDWDPGSSKIFYNPATNNFAQLDLDYLFHRHVSSGFYSNIEGDVPLLFRDRYTKIWSLMSYSKWMSMAVRNSSTAGILQYEQFLISSENASSVIIPSLKHTPQDPNGLRNVYLGKNSDISNFQFVDMAAVDSTFLFVSSPCSSNSIKNKQFNLDFVDNDIENVKDFFQTNYTNRFKTNTKPKTLMALNKTKTETAKISQSYSYGSAKLDRFPDSRNAILKSAVFLNGCLNFTAPGSTFRRTGVFIGLDRVTGAIDADFDEKLLGQWIPVKVTHEFSQTSYTNNITAVKAHADKSISIVDTIA